MDIGGTEPAEVLDRGWPGWLRKHYTPRSKNEPLERIIEVAEGHGVESVLVERRYIDPDYRSEHSRFYAATFQEHHSFCDRLHFFVGRVPDDLDLSRVADRYRGYSVIRPASSNPVGRTMLSPPDELLDACVCAATEEVHPFGYPLRVTAMPFISQDEQYLRCAHAAQWMVLYHAYLAHGSPRRLPEDIHDASRNGRVVGRQVPAEGLSPSQILRSLQALQMSAGIFELPDGGETGPGSLFAMLGRYVSSSMPPIVISNAHAWVVVAYRQTGMRYDDVVLYRHDDSRGPYMRVDDPWDEPNEEHRTWRFAIPPTPQRLYLSAERAEPIGNFWFKGGLSILLGREAPGSVADELGLSVDAGRAVQHQRQMQHFQDGLEGGQIVLRTYAARSHQFKAGADGRLPGRISNLYRRCHLPGHVWVVEAIDLRLWEAGAPCVLGEVLVDPTSNHLSRPDESSRPAVLCLHVAGLAFASHPDHEEGAKVEMADDFEPYSTGALGWCWSGNRAE